MDELIGFERDLAIALRRYAEQRVTTAPAPSAVVQALDGTGELRRPWLPAVRHPARRMVRVLAVAAVIAALLAGLLLAGTILRSGRSAPLLIGGDDSLRVAALDGTSAQILRSGYHRDPRWSSDRAWITAWTDPTETTQLDVLDANDLHLVHRLAATHTAWSPAAAPGGPRMAALDDDGQIFVFDPGRSVTAIDAPGATGGPTWSTDGDRLFWAAGPEIYATTLRDGEAAQTALVTRLQATSALALAILPRERLAAVVTDCPSTCATELVAIWLDDGAVEPLGDVSADTLDVDPTGQHVLTVGSDGDDGAVIAIDVDSAARVRLASRASFTQGMLMRPRYVDGGRSILFEASTRAGFGLVDLWLMAADGTHPRLLALATRGADVQPTR